MNYKGLLEQLYKMTNIPLALYQNEKCILTYSDRTFLPNPVYKLLQPYFQEKDSGVYSMTAEFMQCGFIRIHPDTSTEDPQFLLLGPALQDTGDIGNTRRILAYLEEEDIRFTELHRYLTYHSQVPSSHFLSTLKMLNILLNDSENIHVINMTTPELDKNSDSTPLSPDYLRTLNKMPEKEMLSCIRTGKPQDLMTHILKLPELGILPGELADSHLRSIKNTYVAAATLASRSAIEGGVDYNLALLLSDEYIYKMERITDARELLLSLGQMLIDFAKQTQKVIANSCSDSLVRSITNDIFMHINEKITVESIAGRLSYSTAHLCRHYKEVTGMTLIEGIQMLKIKEAQTLLKDTDLSLSEISVRLAFSSQSYFQKVFKKKTEMTPLQYRDQYKLF
ncbi:MAG: helix-turn-helix transcriptional regulator [Lachnospiraceae bacterium]